jgi:polysaccharide export outer membrane protein
MERIVYSNPIRWSVVAMLLLSVASMWAQVNGSAAQAAVNAIQKDEQKKPQTELNSVTPNAPVGPGDLLEISLFGTPDFHQETRVTTTGDLALPLIGSIHVTGLTPEAVATAIRKKLIEGDFYKDPQVSVLVKDYVAAGIYVLGEVQRPGFYSILKANTLLQAVALAGGTTVKAGRSVTIANPNRTPREVTANLSDDGDAHVKDPAMMA